MHIINFILRSSFSYCILSPSLTSNIKKMRCFIVFLRICIAFEIQRHVSRIRQGASGCRASGRAGTAAIIGRQDSTIVIQRLASVRFVIASPIEFGEFFQAVYFHRLDDEGLNKPRLKYTAVKVDRG